MKKKAQATGKFLDNLWNVAVLVAVTFAAVAVAFNISTIKTLSYTVASILLADVLFKVYKLQSK
ncbi:hypothetical protein KDA08_01930 [Candidatus Saccharibacteria bacterium]|jgi:hypothetical protein|nr:hypothetical protein [Candidatus Saccharibacteria bacterium]